MVKVIGIRFKPVGKVYYFNPANYDIKVGDNVIVETVRGIELGNVVLTKEIEENQLDKPLKAVIRVANSNDMDTNKKNKEKAAEACRLCSEKVKAHGLDMKLVEAEYTFDGSKLLFYFTSEGRVDFRELVKDLATLFRTRIELRQIGVRDESKTVGSVGVCGRDICCSKFLGEFMPVSIKMAKEQGLSLNPTKISGSCGRLMCCLNYEQDGYEWLNSKLPKVGSMVQTPDGKGKVESVSTLKQKVVVRIENKDGQSTQEFDASKVKTIKVSHNDEKKSEKQ